MNRNLAEVIEAGKALEADERLEAAHQLLLTVDQDAGASQAEIDGAWDEVITHRVDEILGGKATLVDGRTAHEQIRNEVASRRK